MAFGTFGITPLNRVQRRSWSMALEKIKGERTLKALKPGAGRINDGGVLFHFEN